ncbi:hypothetical protein HUS23_04545 [Ectothiorhodospiraceae bacterium 2226]|nr:hypothetical protein HUS23_04545 [Ectothiorhodospiraceae bacterium 2226]
MQPQPTVIEGTTHHGKPCRVVDNTGEIDAQELRVVLEALIAERRFGLGGLSAAGGNTITIGEPVLSHAQFGDKLYRLLLFPYELRIESF